MYWYFFARQGHPTTGRTSQTRLECFVSQGLKLIRLVRTSLLLEIRALFITLNAKASNGFSFRIMQCLYVFTGVKTKLIWVLYELNVYFSFIFLLLLFSQLPHSCFQCKSSIFSVTCLAEDVKEPTHVTKRVGHVVPGVVFWLCLTGWCFI